MVRVFLELGFWVTVRLGVVEFRGLEVVGFRRVVLCCRFGFFLRVRFRVVVLVFRYFVSI